MLYILCFFDFFLLFFILFIMLIFDHFFWYKYNLISLYIFVFRIKLIFIYISIAFWLSAIFYVLIETIIIYRNLLYCSIIFTSTNLDLNSIIPQDYPLHNEWYNAYNRRDILQFSCFLNMMYRIIRIICDIIKKKNVRCFLCFHCMHMYVSKSWWK